MLRGYPADQTVYKWARCLLDKGYLVRILLWDRRINKIDTKGLDVATYRLRAPLGKTVVGAMLPFWWLYIGYKIARENPDIVHAFDFDTMVPALLLQKIFRYKLMYTILDFYADTSRTGLLSIAGKALSVLEREAAEAADFVFIVDKSRLTQLSGRHIRNLEVVYNTPPDSNFPKPSGPSNFVFYGGLLSETRGILQLIDAIGKVEGLRLVVAGIGPALKTVVSFSIHPTSKVTYLGWLNYDDILRLTRQSLAIVALYDPSIPNYVHASPNKLFEAMMTGKPIVVNEGTSLASLVYEENCGLVVPYGDVEELAKCLELLFRNSNLRDELARNARKAYEQKYSWSIMEARILESYRKLHNQLVTMHQ